MTVMQNDEQTRKVLHDRMRRMTFEPVWGPLLEAVGESGAADFMFMSTYNPAEGEGPRIHLYKHVDTRRYLNLDDNGNPYAYIGLEGYEPVGRERLPHLVATACRA